MCTNIASSVSRGYGLLARRKIASSQDAMHGPRVEQFGATENHFEDVGFAKIEVANRLDGIGQIDSIGISHRSPKQNRRTIGAPIARKIRHRKRLCQPLVQCLDAVFATCNPDFDEPRARRRRHRRNPRHLHRKRRHFATNFRHDLRYFGHGIVFLLPNLEQWQRDVFGATPTRIGTAMRQNFAEIFLQKRQALDELQIGLQPYRHDHLRNLISLGALDALSFAQSRYHSLLSHFCSPSHIHSPSHFCSLPPPPKPPPVAVHTIFGDRTK